MTFPLHRRGMSTQPASQSINRVIRGVGELDTINQSPTKQAVTDKHCAESRTSSAPGGIESDFVLMSPP
jgi:hypothetical protein